jgi:hypothetical protein
MADMNNNQESALPFPNTTPVPLDPPAVMRSTRTVLQQQEQPHVLIRRRTNSTRSRRGTSTTTSTTNSSSSPPSLSTPSTSTRRSTNTTNPPVSPAREVAFPIVVHNEEEERINEIVTRLESIELNDAYDGDGSDSDGSGEEMDIHETALAETELDRQANASSSSFHLEPIVNGDIAYLIAKTEVSSSTLYPDTAELLSKVHQPPGDWIIPPKKSKMDAQPPEPDFADVDNPGGWNSFVFRPIYAKSGTVRNGNSVHKYVRHELPTGCSPVPLNSDGKRINGEYEFFYQGWESQRPPVRSGATVGNLFPSNRQSSLDHDVLRRLGMSPSRLVDANGCPDALFFFQLVLPICDPQHSGVINDPRSGFYHQVTKFSNIYKHQSGIGNGYGHNITEANLAEFVRFDGCVFRDGVRGGGGCHLQKMATEHIIQ